MQFAGCVERKEMSRIGLDSRLIFESIPIERFIWQCSIAAAKWI